VLLVALSFRQLLVASSREVSARSAASESPANRGRPARASNTRRSASESPIEGVMVVKQMRSNVVKHPPAGVTWSSIPPQE
jgi:hypothetical protein